MTAPQAASNRIITAEIIIGALIFLFSEGALNDISFASGCALGDNGDSIIKVFASPFGGTTNSSSVGGGSISNDVFSAACAKSPSKLKPDNSEEGTASFFSASNAGSFPISKPNLPFSPSGFGASFSSSNGNGASSFEEGGPISHSDFFSSSFGFSSKVKSMPHCGASS